MRGNMKKPLVQAIAEGNPGKRSKADLNLDQPVPDLALPEAPEFLSEEAKIEFNKLAPVLYKNCLLTELDVPQLCILSQCFAQWQNVQAKIEQTALVVKGSQGQAVQNPYFRISMELINQITQSLAAFGMTPAARTKIRLPKKDDDPREDAWKKIAEQRRLLKDRIIQGGKKDLDPNTD